jgi:hypothetical protein
VSARAEGGFVLDAVVHEGVAAPLLAVVGIDDGVANATQKLNCLPVSGFLAYGSNKWKLDDSFASMDYTHGLLARNTVWKWAAASSDKIGFNFVQGFNGPIENAIWFGSDLIKVAPRFLQVLKWNSSLFFPRWEL